MESNEKSYLCGKTSAMKKGLTLTALIKQAKSGKYIGQLQEFPEVLSQGDTVPELLENLQDAFALLMESNRKENKLLAKGTVPVMKRKMSLA
jgi:predicted RNase H-like HicB family nuclease